MVLQAGQPINIWGSAIPEALFDIGFGNIIHKGYGHVTHPQLLSTHRNKIFYPIGVLFIIVIRLSGHHFIMLPFNQ